jgi:hypothetical protein
MAYFPRAQRALDVVSTVVIYRQIGRRPSGLYVDDATTAATAGDAGRHQLSDRIYWRTTAAPGDQIQERAGGVMLVKAGGECYPILLAEPTPLTPETAFTHADLTTKADHAVLEALLAAGSLVDATPRRPRGAARPADQTFAKDHPLVVDELPHGVTLDDRVGPGRQGAWQRRR